MTFPNPWLALAAVLALAGCFGAGVLHGHRAEKQAWALSVARQNIAAAELLAKSEAARAATERTYNTLKDQVELHHAAQESRIDAAYAANRLLLADRGRLYDAHGAGGACRGGNLSADSAASGVDPAPTAGCGLSSQTSQALLDLAHDADRAAAYAIACHDWAMNLGAIATE